MGFKLKYEFPWDVWYCNRCGYVISDDQMRSLKVEYCVRCECSIEEHYHFKKKQHYNVKGVG